ncbi:MAG: hypothetical protein KC419_01480, partial [Anaerolineales bacterium]|nr:hypothetical protein [Anaerolineales bacterium]
ELWGVRDPSTSWGLAIYELKPTWTSLWGRFGYGQIPLPEGIYSGLLWVIGIGLLGLLIPVLLSRKDELKQVGVPLLILVLNVILGFVVVFYYLLISPAGAMGRFFYPALASLSILAFYGFSRWFTLLPQKTPLATHHSLLAIFTNLGMAILTTVALWGYLAPAYARPPSFAAATAVPHPIDAQFDGFVVLRGYEVRGTAVVAGDPLNIDLYWEVVGQPPGNYLLFVHLIDSETGAMVVQRDTHPGLGRFPSRYWQPGDRFIDSIRMWLPETTYTPSTANLSIGLYVPGAYRLGITGADGIGLGDALPLGEITLKPAAFAESRAYPNPQNQNFADTFTLLGYEYDKRVMLPGDLVTVTTYWQTQRPVSGTYRVETFLQDEAGQEADVDVVTAVAADPLAANLAGNEVVTVVQTFRVPPTLPPGSYAFDVRIFDVTVNEPLNLLAEDGHILNNHLLLSRVGLRPFP